IPVGPPASHVLIPELAVRMEANSILPPKGGRPSQRRPKRTWVLVVGIVGVWLVALGGVGVFLWGDIKELLGIDTPSSRMIVAEEQRIAKEKRRKEAPAQQITEPATKNQEKAAARKESVSKSEPPKVAKREQLKKPPAPTTQVTPPKPIDGKHKPKEPIVDF